MMKKGNMLKVCGGIAGLSMVAFFMLTTSAGAKITGICSNCHTMHNSQDGNTVAYSGNGAAWNGGVITGTGGSTAANAQLLVSDCVGCHSNTGGATIVNVGGSTIPIVWNTGGYPANPLAGGNFADVPTDTTTGHNVFGIAGVDTNLSYAPGAFNDTGGIAIGCSNSCHVSLAQPDSWNALGGNEPGGCKGCHNYVAHHANNDANTQPRPTAANGGYRFLGPPAGHNVMGGTVDGVEDPDWEATTSATDHNIYAAEHANDYEDPQSMGKFCAGCHGSFHANGVANNMTWQETGINNGDGGANPWIRHPANFGIPNSGEFTQVIGQAYDPTIPVAMDVQTAYAAGTVNTGDQVFCLSCHRAHGSQYPDMLRFDYSQVIAHTGTGNSTNGCFFCHRNKDNP